MKKHYHLVGIGGIGMGGLAGLLLAKGHKVTGSDAKDSDMVNMLRQQGADIAVGHNASNVTQPDFVAVSTAIKPDNPEIISARAKNIPILRRAELLSQLMLEYKTIAVTGAHGKTTTSSMILHTLQVNDLSPMGAIGGIVRTLSTNIALGQGNYFVAEVDDSDGTHLFFHPDYSVITNMDKEHMDFYRDLDHIAELYEKYLKQTNEQGMIFICGDDINLAAVAKSTGRVFRTFGLNNENRMRPEEITIEGLQSKFDCILAGKSLGRVVLNVPGRHNIINALACISVCLEIGLKFADIVKGLESFRGVERRFQFLGEKNGVVIYDDYAHHPTEIAATCKVAKTLKANKVKRIVGVFQPHRYTRLKHLWKEFQGCFEGCDSLLVTDVYAASEKPIEGVGAELFVEEMKKNTKIEVIYVNRDKLLESVLSFIRPGDLVLTLGAGDITKLGKELIHGKL
ncbi:MAG: UDP-N-acetylmuramate--L-alanine ligase [Candidatus Omnitrophica bacterium]|nr:UDP-N-acetylmuramate--L-alanine ligase [Candidatus Omnitrophota bacterium]